MKPLLMLAATTVAFAVNSTHIGLSDYALLLVAIAYTTSLVRDFRPIRALRAECAELRDELDKKNAKLDEKEAKLAEQTQQFNVLEKTRDFQASFDTSLRAIEEARAAAAAEHAAILEALQKHGEAELEAWTALQREMAANTAVLSTLAAGINAGALAASAPRRRRPATA